MYVKTWKYWKADKILRLSDIFEMIFWLLFRLESLDYMIVMLIEFVKFKTRYYFQEGLEHKKSR